MLTARPILARAASRLAGARSALHPAATIELAPASPACPLPAIALPGEFERVKGLIPTGVWAWERAVAHGEPGTHSATTAVLIRDALWADGTVYAGLRSQWIAPRRRGLVLNGPIEHLAQAQLCYTEGSARYFAHWLIDQLTLELLAAERGMPALTEPTPGWQHEEGYRAIAKLHPRTPRLARVDELWIVDDRHCNAARECRFRALRQRVRAPDARSPRRVYLDRGVTGSVRTLTNRDAVVAALEERGFVIIYPERETPERMVELLSNADVCLGIEGSALAHPIVLMPEGATIVALEPPHRFSALMKPYADMAGQRFAYVVGDDQGQDRFSIDISRLQATLDLVEV